MNKHYSSILRTAIFFSIMGGLTGSCGSDKNKTDAGAVASLNDCPVVAEKVVSGNDTLIVADINLADETIILKLSDIADDIKLIKLDNSDEALTGQGMTWVTEKRIIIYSEGVVRQFDHTGKYLGKIGNKGQGPGEYTIAPYDIYVDEEAGRIYMAQYSATELLTYNAADGSFIGNIPLAHTLAKGRINVDTKNEIITVAAMPFEDSGDLSNIWAQDLKGNVKTAVSKPWIATERDFSNEIFAGTSAGATGFDYSMFYLAPRADSLYVYHENDLHPVFTTTLGSKPDKIPMHEYLSTPSFFAVVLFDKPEPAGEMSYIIPSTTPFIVDRKSLRGNFAHLMLDKFGPIIIEDNWLQQSSAEFFSMTIDPGVLLDMIDQASQEHEAVDKPAMELMNTLKESISPDDNNYVIIGKWKK